MVLVPSASAMYWMPRICPARYSPCISLLRSAWYTDSLTDWRTMGCSAVSGSACIELVAADFIVKICDV